MIKKTKKGFTLLEVAVALAIAGTSMIYTYRLIAEGMNFQRQSILLTNAVFLAKVKMAQIDSSPKLESTSSKGEIPGYTGYSFETSIQEEEMDLLKLAEGGGSKDKKKPNADDLLGSNPNAKMDEYMKKRGKAQGSKTGGLIKVFRIKVIIKYPDGGGEKEYVAETIKSTQYN
jgi:general secretion pathway protein I